MGTTTERRSALADARNFEVLATRIDNWPLPDETSGWLELFVARLIQAGHARTEVPV